MAILSLAAVEAGKGMRVNDSGVGRKSFQLVTTVR